MISILTAVRGRRLEIRTLLKALARQTQKPDELILAVMQRDYVRDLPDPGFPVLQFLVGETETPLASARNAAAAKALGDQLVFLDIDCVPGPDFVADYIAALETVEGAVLGDLRRLSLPSDGGLPDFAALDRRARRRQGPSGFLPADPDRFRSAAFGISRLDWEASGGFDTAFATATAIDADFARSLARAGLPLTRMPGGRAFRLGEKMVKDAGSDDADAARLAAKWGIRAAEAATSDTPALASAARPGRAAEQEPLVSDEGLPIRAVQACNAARPPFLLIAE